MFQQQVLKYLFEWIFQMETYDYYIYLPTPLLRQDMTQGQFLSGVKQVWIQSFPLPRLVA